jgi:DNA-binding response OmpR family regulator
MDTVKNVYPRIFISVNKSIFPRSHRSMPNFQGDEAGGRILLVEDEEDSRDLTVITLSEYLLTCVNDFDGGLRSARREYFDLFIFDNWLIGRSGVELCRDIRKFNLNTPVLFFSAAAYESDIKEALQSGAQAYITKPAIPEELRRMVARLISTAP